MSWIVNKLIIQIQTLPVVSRYKLKDELINYDFPDFVKQNHLKMYL